MAGEVVRYLVREGSFIAPLLLLTLPEPLPVGGSFYGKLCRLVVLGAGVDSVTISDYMGRRAWLILRRPML